MKNDLQKLSEGFLLSLSVSGAARMKRSLSADGVLGATVIGTTYYSLGGPLFYTTLMAFFITGSALSHYQADRKKTLPVEFEKGGERDIMQVFANGCGGVLFLILHRLLGDNAAMLSAFLGAMATVTADTWATEIGVTGKEAPVHILTGKPAQIGTSGAVSVKGTAAAALGALLPGICALAVKAAGATVCAKPFSLSSLVISSWAGGVAGAFADSLLGASVQAQYYCRHCRAFTEKKVHRCGREASFVRGLEWFGNDAVNFTSSIAGAAVSALAYSIMTGGISSHEGKTA